MTGLRIPGLDTAYRTASGKTVDLTVVPPMPRYQDDPDIPLLQEQWLEQAELIYRYRLERWELCTQKIAGINLHDQQEIELAKIQKYGVKYFTTIWASIYEARHDQAGLASGGEFKPFIPYSFQVWYLDWLQERKRSTGPLRNGWASKSRDMGITNANCADTLFGFLFERPFVAKLISRREDLVYQRGNMDAMFERIAVHLDPKSDVCLPEFMLPKGWNYDKHYKENLLTRPDNKNQINGESSSSNSGRGGRSTICHVDEAAFIRGLKLLLSSLFMTTPHTIITSSESVQISDEFGEAVDRVRETMPEALIELDTHLHLFHDERWLADTLESYRIADNEDGFYREVLRQRHRGLSNWIYPTAREMRPLEYEKEFDPAMTLVGGIDPGKADDTAIGWAMIDSDPLGTDTFLDGYSNSYQLPEFYAAIFLGCDPDDMEMLKKYPSFRFRERERLLMEWARNLPQPVIYADPHAAGGSRMADKSDDWYNRMLLFSREFNPRKDDAGRGRPLVIVKNYKAEMQPHKARHNALNDWLQRLEFSGTAGARRFHHAIANSKYDIATSARISEQVEPSHDTLSHMRTCAEYMAANVGPARKMASRKQSGQVEIIRPINEHVRGATKHREQEPIDPYDGAIAERDRRSVDRERSVAW